MRQPVSSLPKQHTSVVACSAASSMSNSWNSVVFVGCVVHLSSMCYHLADLSQYGITGST